MPKSQPYNVYAIAIYNPPPGIEATIAHEIGQRPTISSVQTSLYADNLAIVSYTQQPPRLFSGRSARKDRDAVEQRLMSMDGSYARFPAILMSEDVSSDSSEVEKRAIEFWVENGKDIVTDEIDRHLEESGIGLRMAYGIYRPSELSVEGLWPILRELQECRMSWNL